MGWFRVAGWLELAPSDRAHARLLPFHCNCVSILHRFWDIVIYWWPHWHFIKFISVRKLESMTVDFDLLYLLRRVPIEWMVYSKWIWILASFTTRHIAYALCTYYTGIEACKTLIKFEIKQQPRSALLWHHVSSRTVRIGIPFQGGRSQKATKDGFSSTFISCHTYSTFVLTGECLLLFRFSIFSNKLTYWLEKRLWNDDILCQVEYNISLTHCNAVW